MEKTTISKNEIEGFKEEVQRKNQDSITDMIQSIIMQEPFGKRKFYIFIFSKKQLKENDPRITLLYQPRLTKPEPMPNTQLYRVNPMRQDEVEIMWILPDDVQVNLFKKGKIFENQVIADSLHNYINYREKMRQPEPDDLPDYQVKEIYKSLLSRGKDLSFYPF